MQLGNVSVSSFTVYLAFVWLLIGLYNRKAFIMLATLVIYTALQAFTEKNFPAFIISSALYFYVAQSNITFLSYFRKAFISFGIIYFAGAADQFLYYHFSVDTKFDIVQSWLLVATNAYVLAGLLGGGGAEGAKYNGMRPTSLRGRLFGLSLHKENSTTNQG